MASNGKPQLITHVFSLQANGAAGNARNAAVGQDKGRISSARIATAQPASRTHPLRAQALNTGAARSKNKPKPKRQTIHLTLWVEPIVKRELQRIAQAEGLTVSKTGAAILKQALQHNVDMHYSALLTPIIEAAIDKRMRARDARLAFLLARNAFSSEQTRALAANILGRQSGMTEETLKTILEMTKRTAKGNLTRRNPELEELIGVIKQWLDGAEQEPAQ
jgi:hypothetical protein